MKKSIESFMNRLKENVDGTISGGFGSIRGGTTMGILGNNDACQNTKSCSGVNSGCTNSGTCSGSSNRVTTCTNTGNCFT